MPGPVEAANDRDQSILGSRKAGLDRPIVAILVRGSATLQAPLSCWPLPETVLAVSDQPMTP